ncbi:MAG: hypothetical protein EOP84_35340 [Verrucomicrobiaceae bacterium]|nr:MAG: hypothetical protein EOP84_35340 [Verrucomicrobiaceae bacterium]
MSISADSTVTEVAFEVGNALAQAGIRAVLSGGGAATIYAPEAYQTRDLDFILLSRRASVGPILALGFKPIQGTAMYEHPDIPFTLEFPAGPVAVGDEVITEWAVLRDAGRELTLLTPTDCVRDRLAAAIHWKDWKSVEQAALVGRNHPIDLKKIEEWCAEEGGTRVFEEFRTLVG